MLCITSFRSKGFTWLLFGCGILICSHIANAQPPAFRNLVENFDKMSSNEVLNSMRQLDQNDWLQMSVYSAFASWAHLRVCEVDASIVINLAGMPTNCQQTYQQWQQTYQFNGGNLQKTFEYAQYQRDQILIGMKCSSGEIDQQTCSTYAAGVQNYNDMTNETTQTIIDNMGDGQCDNPGGYDWRGYCQPR